ncbi:helix-turn-helix transcriptional regulator [Budviciaceae bacterium CWB-B4]|uniref:Helix-turn-helix transcriptional regulator n=1 Tax=Limnobaculum xujianqingii TaxID=2738837 RepID=A0A9D7AIX6_9GAMM|nr:helix-turn-helix transcriptional regulator [Limnobaculum xujianqingii]MBK5073349.1 helix-turn-helix transcriptional regulator [Limnobaculum xujianqingii]MBK5176920.1 helix-turn-helix transcriptional regulator [Limnobaculum xujianqingii]
MKFNTVSDSEIISELCRRIKETRIAMRLSQIELAERAQVGIATIKRVEMGEAVTLSTLIGILRGLDRLHQLEGILFDSEVRAFNAQITPDAEKAPVRIRKKSGESESEGEKNPAGLESNVPQDDSNWYTLAAKSNVVWPWFKPEKK